MACFGKCSVGCVQATRSSGMMGFKCMTNYVLACLGLTVLGWIILYSHDTEQPADAAAGRMSRPVLTNYRQNIPEFCSDVRLYADYFPKVEENANIYTKRIPGEYLRLSWTNTVVDAIKFRHSPTGVCSGNEYLLWIVLSGRSAWDARAAVRESYGGLAKVNGKKFVLVFILGNGNQDHQKRIDKEAEIHNDIIQADFTDTYRNMTIKTILALRWALKHCASAQYVSRITDDVLVNTFKLIGALNSYKPTRVLYGCPQREYILIYREGKFRYWSEVQWTASKWPPYQDGFFILMSMDVVKDLYLLACKTPMTWPDDTHIGALATMLNLRLLGRGEDCIAIGHKPNWNVTEQTLVKLVDPETSVLFAHFGGNPVLTNIDTTKELRKHWARIMQKQHLYVL